MNVSQPGLAQAPAALFDPPRPERNPCTAARSARSTVPPLPEDRSHLAGWPLLVPRRRPDWFGHRALDNGRKAIASAGRRIAIHPPRRFSDFEAERLPRPSSLITPASIPALYRRSPHDGPD